MNTFVKRTLSGAVYAGLVVSSILVHPAFFGLLMAVVSVWAVVEFHRLTGSSTGLTIRSAVLAAVGALVAGGYSLFPPCGFSRIRFVLWGVLGMSLLLMFCLVYELFAKADNPIRNWGALLVSFLMIALPFDLMNAVAPWALCGEDKFVLLALFVTVWVNDSGAYIVGSLTSKRKGGNHKMFPRVSPNKSWEGLIGGIVFALLSGYVYFRVGWFDSLWIALIFTLIISIFGTLGDLMESLFKRTLGVKDSGKFMPGHGGVLDRFDSLLLATPAVVAFLLILSALH